MNTTTKPVSQDPIGQAILDYSKFKKPFDIIVSSDLCDDDIIPIEVLFRSYDEMPEIEKMALAMSKGKVLDAGAGAGVHAKYLIEKGFTVTCIDSSKGAVDYLKSQQIQAQHSTFFSYKPNQKFDTILMLMNGIGIAGKLSQLEKCLRHAWDLLNEGGQLICDSSDVKYLYEDEDGSFLIDLNSEYYGNFRFQMHYKKIAGPWFDWLYVDYENLHEVATKIGFVCRRVEETDDHYLAQLLKP